jgi:hypothetical protein
MKSPIPQTDSIDELAEFWQSPEVTDFSDELEEVEPSVFGCDAATGVVLVRLSSDERSSLRKFAASQGVEEAVLVRQWVREKLPQP